MLLIFGPDKLPEMARTLGSAYKEFQSATATVQREARVLQDTITTPITTLPTAVTPTPVIDVAATTTMPPVELAVQPVAIETPTVTLVGAQSESDKEQESLIEIARIMGISTEGKSVEQLKNEVREKLGSDTKQEVK